MSYFTSPLVPCETPLVSVILNFSMDSKIIYICPENFIDLNSPCNNSGTESIRNIYVLNEKLHQMSAVTIMPQQTYGHDRALSMKNITDLLKIKMSRNFKVRTFDQFLPAVHTPVNYVLNFLKEHVHIV